MDNAIVTQSQQSVIESVVIGGDLSKLTSEQRVNYYNAVCKSLGLNPLTRPFDYIVLNGKLTLYARKDAAEQLREINDISIGKPEINFQDDWIIVTVTAQNGRGRTDADLGVVNKKDMRGDFGNALMKAVTKAKRRVTLSICGLGMLDETEVETIPGARPVIVNDSGEIVGTKVIEVKQNMPPEYAERYEKPAAAAPMDLDNQAQAAPAPINNGVARPYQPETLREKLLARAVTHAKKAVSDKQIALAAHLLGLPFVGEHEADKMRHAVQEYLFDKPSLKDAPAGAVIAILNDWLMPKVDSGGAYSIDATAEKEIRAVYAEALRMQGQMEMPL